MHLFFADDLFLLAEADVDQVWMVRDVLDVFGTVSGHKVNANKMDVFFFKNIEPCATVEICNILGFAETDDLGYCLGMSLFH